MEQAYKLPDLTEYYQRYGVEELGALALQARTLSLSPLERHILDGLAKKPLAHIYAQMPPGAENAEDAVAAYESLLGRLGARHDAHATRIGIEADLIHWSPLPDYLAHTRTRPIVSPPYLLIFDVYTRGFNREQTAEILKRTRRNVQTGLQVTRRQLGSNTSPPLPLAVFVAPAYGRSVLQKETP